jgi:hypothetical protein
VPHSCTREHSPDVVAVPHVNVLWLNIHMVLVHPSNVFFMTNVVSVLTLNVLIKFPPSFSFVFLPSIHNLSLKSIAIHGLPFVNQFIL